MSRVYSPVPYILDGRIRYLIWYTSGGDGAELDGLVVGQASVVLAFNTISCLISYAEMLALSPLEGEGYSERIDLDSVQRWLKRKRPRQVNCKRLLNAWNLFGDLSSTVGGSFDPDHDQTNKVYDKLFWGSNLPSMTPPGECFVPVWPQAQIRLLRQVLGVGLALFRRHVRVER